MIQNNSIINHLNTSSLIDKSKQTEKHYYREITSSKYDTEDIKHLKNLDKVSTPKDEAADKFLSYNKVSSPTVIIGILSNSDYACLRDTHRKIFIPKAKEYKLLNIKVFFLLDNPTPELQKEQEINKDIVYLNTTIHGWDRGFAKKLHTWYRFAVEHFPDALVIGRMDDDVFVCTPQIFDRLNEVKHPLLYYGYESAQDCLDDMFLFIGMDLAQRITKRHMCEDKKENLCLDNGNAVLQLRKWISIYNDIIRVDEKPSGKMIHFYSRGKLGKTTMQSFYRRYKQDFCKKYLLFHKANSIYMYELNRDNSLNFNYSSNIELSQQEVQNIYNCRINNF